MIPTNPEKPIQGCTNISLWVSSSNYAKTEILDMFICAAPRQTCMEVWRGIFISCIIQDQRCVSKSILPNGARKKIAEKKGSIFRPRGYVLKIPQI